MNKYRSKEEIIADMLSVVMKKMKKTQIMYGANISYTLLCKYLDKLIESGLVKLNGNGESYALTPRGIAYLKRFEEYKVLKKELTRNESLFNEKKGTLLEMLEG